MDLIKEVEYRVDNDYLISVVDEYIDNPDYSNYNFKGLSLQHRNGISDPWDLIDGLESKDMYKDCREHDFSVINDRFQNTVISNIINDFELYRTRILVVSHKSCYSIHQDSSWRLHIPIVTNNSCFFFFPAHQQSYTLETGKVYLVNTTEKHTFINAGSNPRMHLVGCIDL